MASRGSKRIRMLARMAGPGGNYEPGAERNVSAAEAKELIERSIALRPGDGYIMDSLAWVFYRQGLLEKAKDTIERALKLMGDDPVIWDHYGDILRDLGNIDEAAEAYRKSLEIKPTDEKVKNKLESLR